MEAAAEESMRPTFVVADAHGNAQQVLSLLELAGAYPASGPRPLIVQLGDLANCVASSVQDDLEALDLVHSGVIDLLLVGNHEHPYFGGGGFGGYWPDPEVRRSIRRVGERGGLLVAVALGDLLISHAGLTSQWLHRCPADHPARIADWLNDTFAAEPRHAIFSQVGHARGGWDAGGGVLWADWREPKPRSLMQLVGHTVGADVRRRAGATCIDLGGGKGSRIAGAWVRDGELEVVVHDRAEAAAA